MIEASDRGISRRGALGRLIGAVAGLFAAGCADSRGLSCLEGQTIRWLVGYSPGGGYDVYARLVEPFLEATLRAQIMIQNLPGAAGAVALRTLADARPDGRTIGIFDGPGALWSVAANERDSPDLERDLTILGRVARLQHTLVTGPRSGARTVEELIAIGRQRRLVFGATAPSSQNFVTCSVLAKVFGLDVDYVIGYPGSRELMLAVIRGDFDAMSLSIESGLDSMGPDGVIPLLLTSEEPFPYPELAGLPRLGGTDGLEQDRPDLFTSTPEEVRNLTEAIHGYLDFGRVIAAPAGLPDSLLACLESAVWSALQNPDLAAAAKRARRSLAIASGEQARADVARGREAVARILPIAAEAATRAR